MAEDKDIPMARPAPEAQSWRDYMLEQEQKTPERIEDVAKALSGMVSVSLSIFLTVGKARIAEESSSGVLWALGIWLLSLLLSFIVAFPFPYKYSQHSHQTFMAAHQTIIRRKYGLLIAAVLLFVIALGILSWEVFA